MTNEIESENFKSLKKDLSRVAKRVEQTMSSHLPFDKIKDQPLFNAMAYASLTGGKRIRPYLLYMVAEIYDVPLENTLQVAAAIEFVHCASLIHDDLPCMDNADLRRGVPSCHKQFREDIALLAGDSLLILPYDILQNEKVHKNPEVRLDLIRSLARFSGVKGIMLGQTMDILRPEDNNPNIEYTRKLSELKTGSLLAFCCEAGAILGNASVKERQHFHDFGLRLGVLYQLVDDLLDVEGAQHQVGKPINQDAENNKNTFIQVLGIDGAKAYRNTLLSEINTILKDLDRPIKKLEDFISFILSRTS
jgi:farnesyl diphosphate synthase